MEEGIQNEFGRFYPPVHPQTRFKSFLSACISFICGWKNLNLIASGCDTAY